ncbi:MAG: hypothetical protein IJD22_02530 [Clostridia bacterium]|nr:hypothetical protein [Clostridia bacterium]
MAKEKFKSADEVAEEYLELEMSLGPKSRFENILLTVLTLAFVFIFAILFWIIPDKTFSEEENAPLSTFPEFTVEGFIHGDFNAEFGTYMADQFPLRNFFIGVKAFFEAAQLKGQNNNVILGGNGYLFARNDYPNEDNLKSNVDSLANFIPVAEKKGISCTFAVAGRKMDVMDEYIPTIYGTYYSDRIFGILDGMCDDAELEYLNLRDTLNDIGDAPLYYKTDHHWTSLGAYYAYRDIAEELGITPYELSDFNVETASEEFYGTTWSSAGVKWADPDTIEYYRWEGDESITLRIQSPSYDYKNATEITESGVSYDVFDTYYVRELLETKDKYASFLGGKNNSYIEVTMTDENGEPVEGRETLLLMRDSFSDSLAPFLARHYDLILIDLRTSSPDAISMCIEKEIDNILFIYNMESLTEAPTLGVLNKGLSAHRK